MARKRSRASYVKAAKKGARTRKRRAEVARLIFEQLERAVRRQQRVDTRVLRVAAKRPGRLRAIPSEQSAEEAEQQQWEATTTYKAGDARHGVSINIRIRTASGRAMTRDEAAAAFAFLVEHEHPPRGYELQAVDWTKGGKVYHHDNLVGALAIVRAAGPLRIDAPDEFSR